MHLPIYVAATDEPAAVPDDGAAAAVWDGLHAGLTLAVDVELDELVLETAHQSAVVAVVERQAVEIRPENEK